MIRENYLLSATVFIVGALIMTFEILGLGVIAPYFGTSLAVSSNLIGIFLGSLALGYFLGGFLADTYPTKAMFSYALFGSALHAGLLLPFRDLISGFLTARAPDVIYGSFTAGMILFGPLAFLLGMILPLGIKLRVQELSTAGKRTGNLYALSSIGGVCGAFLTGFFLVPYFTLPSGLFIAAVALFILSFLYNNSKKYPAACMVLATLLFGSTQTLEYHDARDLKEISDGSMSIIKSHLIKLADVNSQYSRIQIYEGTDTVTSKKIRLMRVNRELHSGTFVDNNELLFNYAKFNELGGHFNPDAKRALLIGGGGYSYAKFFLGDTPLFDVDKIWEFDGKKYSNHGKVTIPFLTSSDPKKRLEKPVLISTSTEPGSDPEHEGSTNFIEAENQNPGEKVVVKRAGFHDTGFPSNNGYIHIHEIKEDGSLGPAVSPNTYLYKPHNYIGHSDLLSGENNNVVFKLDRKSKEGEVLYAMLHRDNGNGQFDQYLVDGYSKIQRMDVVEIDPKTTELAIQYFYLNDQDPRLRIFHEDGRTYINRTKDTYDIIYIDAFRSFYVVPFQLTTQEAVHKLYQMLDSQGVIVVNVPSALTGGKGRFFEAELKTYRSVFPEVRAYAVTSPTDETMVQNIVLVGFKSKDTIRTTPNDDEKINERLAHRSEKPLPEGTPILTDGLAPTDYFINLFANLQTL